MKWVIFFISLLCIDLISEDQEELLFPEKKVIIPISEGIRSKTMIDHLQFLFDNALFDPIFRECTIKKEREEGEGLEDKNYITVFMRPLIEEKIVVPLGAPFSPILFEGVVYDKDSYPLDSSFVPTLLFPFPELLTTLSPESREKERMLDEQYRVKDSFFQRKDLMTLLYRGITVFFIIFGIVVVVYRLSQSNKAITLYREYIQKKRVQRTIEQLEKLLDHGNIADWRGFFQVFKDFFSEDISLSLTLEEMKKYSLPHMLDEEKELLYQAFETIRYSQGNGSMKKEFQEAVLIFLDYLRRVKGKK